MTAAEISLLRVMNFSLPKYPRSRNSCLRSCWKRTSTDQNNWLEDAACYGQHPLFVGIVCLLLWLPGACVGTAIIIDFAKQVEIVCLPGRGVCWNCTQGRSLPSHAGSARTFAAANCPLRTPLNCVFFDCREYGWQNQSGANNGNLFRYRRFSPWHFWNRHSLDLF